jgi:hypothetical protein
LFQFQFLRGDDIEKKQVLINNYLIPFIEDMLQFPISTEEVFVEDIVNQYINEIWELVIKYIIGMFQTTGDATDELLLLTLSKFIGATRGA